MVEAVVLCVLFVIVSGVPMWLFYGRRRAAARLMAILRNAYLDSREGTAAVVMDIGTFGVVLSVMSTAAGDASIYTHNGSGFIGGIEDETVSAAAMAFVAQVQSFLQRFTLTTEHPYAEFGEARIYLRTPQELYVASAQVKDLKAKRSELSPLWFAGQNVITQLRLVHQGK
jgi:hypothetical protein